MIKVLFVCLGNICRSPLAEAVFNDQIRKRGLEDKIISDSAGTGAYHIGHDPDPRTIECATGHDIPIAHKARQFRARDLDEFNYVIAMDHSNLQHILNNGGKLNQNVFLMRDFDEKDNGGNVPDPYYDGMSGFEEVYRILNRSCTRFIQYLVDRHKFEVDG